MRTAFSRSYADGSLVRAVVAPRPVNYRDVAGVWQPIDTTLTRSASADGRALPAGYAWQNTAAAYALALPADLGAAPVQVRAGTARVELALVGARGPGRAKANTATYSNVLPGVTAAYAAEPDRVKETLTLAGPSAPSTFTFALTTSHGVVPSLTADGDVALTAAGRRIGTLAAPFMTDAAGATSTAVKFGLARAGGDGWRLTETVDRAWLTAKDRAWPVVVDPSITLGGNSGSYQGPYTDCHIAAANPTTNYCGTVTVKAGNDGTGKWRGLLNFTGLTNAVPEDAQVLDADLALNVTNRTTTTPAAFDVHEVTRPWTTAVTWNKSDATTSWTTPGGDYTATAAATNPSVGEQDGSFEHWQPTALVQAWVDGTKTNNSLLVKQTGAETVTNLISFSSWDAAVSGNWPTLTVRYSMNGGEQSWFSYTNHRITDRANLLVNNGSGQLTYHATDIHLGGAGLPLQLDRFYNLSETDTGTIGTGWSLSIGPDVYLEPLTDGATLYRDPSGTMYRFAKNGAAFTAPPGANAKLVSTGANTYTITYNKTREVYTFDSLAGTAPNGRFVMTRHAERNGNAITVGYDTTPRMTSITDTQGRVLTVSYTGAGRIDQISDPTGRVWDYNYTGTDLTSYTDPNTDTTGYTLNAAHELTATTDPRGNQITLSYTGTPSRVGTLTYVKDPATGTGDTSTFAYQTTAVTACTGVTGVQGSTQLTDPNAGVTTYCRDNQDKILRAVDQLGHKRSSTYTANNDAATAIMDNGSAITTFTHDTLNNLTKIQAPTTAGGQAGYTISASYASAALPYQPTSSTDSQGNCSTYGYDTAGNLTDVYPGQTTSPCNTAPPSGTHLINKYDGDPGVDCSPKTGQLCATINGRGYTTSYSYDSAGNLTRITPPTGLGATVITPDALGRPADVTDGKGQKTSYTYDGADRVKQVLFNGTSVCDTSSTCIKYTYTGAGDVQSREDNTGTTTFDYDKQNRLKAKNLPGGTSTAVTYDDNGNIDSYTDPGGTVAYSYDAANQVTALAEPGGSCPATPTVPNSTRCSIFGYDNDGHRTTIGYPSGQTITTGYETDGRVKTISSKRPNGTTVIASRAYTYLKTGTSTDTTARYTSTDQAGAITTYGYDTQTRLTSAIIKTSGGATTYSEAYTYDANGNRTHSTVQTAIANYGYNPADQLCWLGAGTGGTATGVCPATQPAGYTAMTYDANGNLLNNPSVGALSYNTKNQTTAINYGTGTLTLDYADLDQTERVTAGSTTYLTGLLGLASQSGATPLYFTRLPDGTLISMRQGAGGTSTNGYYTLDALGSVLAVTDPAGTTDTHTYTYEAFGRVITATGTTNPYRFASGYWDTTTKLYKYGTRYYDPRLGRFTQQDPNTGRIGNPNTVNRYPYAANNPCTNTDPTGRCTVGDATNGVLAATGLTADAEAAIILATGEATAGAGEIVLAGFLGAAIAVAYIGCQG